MNRKQKKIVRILAIVLAVLLAGGAVVSAIISIGYAEELPAVPRNEVNMKIEYLEEEQALRITQRLVYTNTSGISIDRVIFKAAANIFRRSSALFYEDDVLNDTFPYGYQPGGIVLNTVLADGAAADYGFRNQETELRVACDLDNGDSCTFEFNYDILLTPNSAFLGIGETGWRLSDFYFTPEYIDPVYGESICESAVSFTRYIFTPAADYDVTIELPDSCLVAASGLETAAETNDHTCLWTIHAENIHDFSLVFGAKYRLSEAQTESGVSIRCLTDDTGSQKKAIQYAEEAVTACESMFGTFPFRQFDIVETDLAAGYLSTSGVLWINSDTLRSDSLKHIIRYAVAQQYFGFTAYAEPAADAWLSDSICEYIAYLITEKNDGHDAYLKELNAGVLPSLQYTIPGGFVVTSDASLMTESEYKAVIRDRGAAVFHELSIDMGTDALISGLRAFYEMGLTKSVLTEMDLVSALNTATGYDWEKALTDWVFNIGDYANQSMDSLD